MTTKTLLLTLSLCSVIGFVITVFMASDPFSRIGYGLLVSSPPALFTLLAPKFARSSKWRVVVTYFVLFALVIVLQGVLR